MLYFVGLVFALLAKGIQAAPDAANHGPPPPKQTPGLESIDHVVLFMQENRAFDHYFGTMAGVRGFADPNVALTSEGIPVWYQKVDSTLSNKTTALLPFYLNEAGGNFTKATQCMTAGSNGWTANHIALNNGSNNLWALDNTPQSIGYFKRQDISTHFAIAEAFTVGDMYAQSMIASTDPNRIFWASGSANIPGGPQSPDQGGPSVDNNETPGCDPTGVSCFPVKWSTFPEHLEAANISWQVYQDTDNFDDNPLAWFEQFQQAPTDSPLAKKGLSFIGIDSFLAAAANGTLPAVSYIIGAMELSEHPPWQPQDGGFIQAQIVNAVINSPKYNSTALIISYDETGGWADHVIPTTSPFNTSGEWMPTDPFEPGTTAVVAGPGFRLPFYVISPWTRGGNVYTAHSDHTSQIMFLEQWLAAKGTPVKTPEINFWRRENMDNLVKMFNFANPDFSNPNIPMPPPPLTNSKGQFIGAELCEAMFPETTPPIPYGQQTRENSLFIENGFKSVRGSLTEGRFLVFQADNMVLSYDHSTRDLGLTSAPPSSKFASSSDDIRFVLHATSPPPATTFKLQFTGAPTNTYIDKNLKGTSSLNNAAIFNITDLGNGQGYTINSLHSSEFIALSSHGKTQEIALNKSPTSFQVFSVTKSTDSGTGFSPGR